MHRVSHRLNKRNNNEKIYLHFNLKIPKKDAEFTRSAKKGFFN